jgi:homoserine kinase
MTKGELRVLRPQLSAGRARLREVAEELAALSTTVSGSEPTVVELMAAGNR